MIFEHWANNCSFVFSEFSLIYTFISQIRSKIVLKQQKETEDGLDGWRQWFAWRSYDIAAIGGSAHMHALNS